MSSGRTVRGNALTLHRLVRDMSASTAGFPGQTVGHIRTCQAKATVGPLERPVPDHLREVDGRPTETLAHLLYECENHAVVAARLKHLPLACDIPKALREGRKCVLNFVSEIAGALKVREHKTSGSGLT